MAFWHSRALSLLLTHPVFMWQTPQWHRDRKAKQSLLHCAKVIKLISQVPIIWSHEADTTASYNLETVAICSSHESESWCYVSVSHPGTNRGWGAWAGSLSGTSAITCPVHCCDLKHDPDLSKLLHRRLRGWPCSLILQKETSQQQNNRNSITSKVLKVPLTQFIQQNTVCGCLRGLS